jgi:quaternary ammonium compound-resistance protein SugE
VSPALAWTMLVASGLLDVAWAYATKRSEGMTVPGWTAMSLILLAAFILLLSNALRVLPLGSAYVVWTGIGTLGSLATGILLLGEPVGALRLMFASITLVGIIGLKAAS